MKTLQEIAAVLKAPLEAEEDPAATAIYDKLAAGELPSIDECQKLCGYMPLFCITNPELLSPEQVETVVKFLDDKLAANTKSVTLQEVASIILEQRRLAGGHGDLSDQTPQTKKFIQDLQAGILPEESKCISIVRGISKLSSMGIFDREAAATVNVTLRRACNERKDAMSFAG